MRPAREPRVAVAGATGAVGNQLVDLIAARGFSHRELKLFATDSEAERTIAVIGEECLTEPLTSPADLAGFDLAFLALPAARAAEIIAARPGPMLIDLSAAGRSVPGAAMTAPGLTPRAVIDQLRGTMVFAVPHPAAHALAACIDALGAHGGFRRGNRDAWCKRRRQGYAGGYGGSDGQPPKRTARSR